MECKVQQEVKGVVERNAFFVHPENLLVTMMSDSEDSLRDQGLDIVLAVRNQKLGDAARKIRQFRVPPLNLEAESYPDMIKRDKLTVTEPPMTAPLTDSIIEGVRGLPLDLPSFP